MNKILIATHNQGKLKEIRELLAPLAIEVVSASEFNLIEPEETGLTFVENAIIKARAGATQSGLPCLADDSGLEVDALQGAPGIHSARFSGLPSNDENNNKKLLELLKDNFHVPRTARFQCVMVLMRHSLDPTPLISQGTWEGEILLKPQGVNGFGYDPLFYVPELGCSAAEISSEEKNRISHRGQALKKLIELITQANS